MQKTADTFFLHRNTLIYRLNKIIEDTGTLKINLFLT
ncbi:helix-turn-helix domain-containing protein [Oceanobacillus chungangensis]|uniref:PucR C-terminal helix-turn-helix domain-containing protein n=1 Tax=Oceanobacillus chungangensis TaxID=1229152 RepID=A0A3D8PKF4_9BACI|nr:hypothetical protein CWR45_17070 [Oceanobacillus chungangensis]